MLERPTATSSDHFRWLWPARKPWLGWSGFSTVDVRDALHRMALPEELSECFAREFGVYELDGKPLGVDDYLWLCCLCLPMGFSWAVYPAQQEKTAAVVESTGIAESEHLHDGTRGQGFCLYRQHRAH